MDPVRCGVTRQAVSLAKRCQSSCRGHSRPFLVVDLLSTARCSIAWSVFYRILTRGGSRTLVIYCSFLSLSTLPDLISTPRGYLSPLVSSCLRLLACATFFDMTYDSIEYASPSLHSYMSHVLSPRRHERTPQSYIVPSLVGPSSGHAQVRGMKAGSNEGGRL